VKALTMPKISPISAVASLVCSDAAYSIAQSQLHRKGSHFRMSGSIPQSFISTLTDRIDLYSLINSRVPLRKSGTSYKACCPFHEEKTPSFNVLPDKGYYHCFGCGAHGDAISFLREYDNLSFVDAIESLARTAGLEVPRDEIAKASHDKTRHLLKATEFACQFYQTQLAEHPAQATAWSYLRRRGLSDEVISTFGLGFAPPEKSALYSSSALDIKKSLVELKLVSDNYATPFDLFRNRIMFPIRNTRGQVIAFGGRTLGDDKAKYINSPESDIFHKSHEIYGLYEAGKANRHLDSLLVVEGYIDVISLAQYGITNAVATLGTATNSDNLKALLRHSQKIVFCFDGDNAGRNAAKKAMENSLPLLEDGLDIRFLLLPQGDDPDTLIRKEGTDKFNQRIENARALSSFLIDCCSEDLDLQQPEHKGILKKRADEQIERIASATIKRNMKSEIYKLTSPWQNQRDNSWQKGKFQKAGNGKPDYSSTLSTSPTAGAETSYYNTKTSYYNKIENTSFSVETGARICLGLYYQPALKNEIEEKLHECKQNPTLRQTFEFIDFLQQESIATTKDLLFRLATSPQRREQFKNLFNSVEHFPMEEPAIADAFGEINQLQIMHIEQRISEILRLETNQNTLNATAKQELKELYVKKQLLKSLVVLPS
jgi:DNA primase